MGALYFLEILKARKRQPKSTVRHEGKKPWGLSGLHWSFGNGFQQWRHQNQWPGECLQVRTESKSKTSNKTEQERSVGVGPSGTWKSQPADCGPHAIDLDCILCAEGCRISYLIYILSHSWLAKQAPLSTFTETENLVAHPAGTWVSLVWAFSVTPSLGTINIKTCFQIIGGVIVAKQLHVS